MCLQITRAREKIETFLPYILLRVLTLLVLESHFGDKPHYFQVVCPQDGTAVLKGVQSWCLHPPNTSRYAAAAGHLLYLVYPNLSLTYAVQYLCSTGSAQEKYRCTRYVYRCWYCCRSCRTYTTPTGQHELLMDHADHTDEGVYLSALKDLDHQVGMICRQSV